MRGVLGKPKGQSIQDASKMTSLVGIGRQSLFFISVLDVIFNELRRHSKTAMTEA